MKKISNIDLSVNGNNFEIRLPKWFITICTYYYDGQINCVMNVMDEENNKTFFFDTVEESISFVYEVVIDKQYEEWLKKPKQIRKK